MTFPRSFWQGEELRLGQALLTFDPLHNQPEAPGYPLLVALGRLVNVFTGDPFVALVALSVIASVAGAVLLERAATHLLGNRWLGLAASLALWLSPAMLVFTPLPNGDAVAVAAVCATVYAVSRQNGIAIAIAAAAAIGVRPQIAPAMLLLVLVTALLDSRRDAVSSASRTPFVSELAAFLVCLAVIFVPIVEAIGASRVASYASSNFEAVKTISAASGVGGRDLALRLIAHPWGSKAISFPLLAAAIVGLGLLVIRRRSFPISLFALFGFAAMHVALCWVAGDRTAGVQPVLPALVIVAIFAAAAFVRWPLAGLIAALAYGAASFAYAWPMLSQRSGNSPAAAATAYASAALRPDAVVLYEPSMEAWAHRVSRRVLSLTQPNELVNHPQTPLFLLADGRSRRPGTVTFWWDDSDAYGKISTESGRVVSIIPIPAGRRYHALSGIHQLERAADGREWRWTGADAVFEVANLGVKEMIVQLSLPADGKLESNRVTLTAGLVQRTVLVRRGEIATVSLPPASPIHIRPEKTFNAPGDNRALGVQFIGLELREAGGRPRL